MLQVTIKRHSLESPWTYQALDQVQRQFDYSIGKIFVSELAPVITLGKRARKEDLLLSDEKLNRLGIEIYPTDRGGLATYHGPGQWVVFVVDRLEKLVGDSRGVSQAVCLLLQCAQDFFKKLKIETEVRSGEELGVWTKKGKIASVGVSVHGGVLLHGFSLNIFKTETSFVGLKPCGLDAAVDYAFMKPISDPELTDLGGLISDLTASRVQSYKHSQL